MDISGESGVRRAISDAASGNGGGWPRYGSEIFLNCFRAGYKYQIVGRIDEDEAFTNLRFHSDDIAWVGGGGWADHREWHMINEGFSCARIVPDKLYSSGEPKYKLEYLVPIHERDLSPTHAVRCVQAWEQDLENSEKIRQAAAEMCRG